MLWLIPIVLAIYLIYREYIEHDCINGKKCYHRRNAPAPNKEDSVDEALLKIHEMVRSTYTYVRWRQALIVGLLVPIPMSLLLTKKLPNLGQWAVMTAVIFIGGYLSASWIHSHFYYPTSRQIERNLLMIRAKCYSRGNGNQTATMDTATMNTDKKDKKDKKDKNERKDKRMDTDKKDTDKKMLDWKRDQDQLADSIAEILSGVKLIRPDSE